MRVALFGGTFDPIHRGHLAIAAAAAHFFELDRVLFATAGRQPLKQDWVPAPYRDRSEMVRLAVAEDARFAVSELDAPHADGSPNFTVDSLEALRAEMPEAALFVLVGADSFLTLPRWRDPDRLIELAEWIVVSRPGFSPGELAGLTSAQLRRVHLLNNVHEDVSATDLRRLLALEEDCSDLVPPTVLEYIREHQLYRKG